MSKVIQFEIKQLEHRQAMCPHTNLALDEERRYIRCVECDCVLDPFDWLLDHIKWLNRSRRNLYELKQEIEAKNIELIAFKTKLKLIKAQIRYRKPKN